MELFGTERVHNRFDYAGSEGPQKQKSRCEHRFVEAIGSKNLGIVVKTIIDTHGMYNNSNRIINES